MRTTIKNTILSSLITLMLVVPASINLLFDHDDASLCNQDQPVQIIKPFYDDPAPRVPVPE